jgi:hypothetical protein
MSQRIGGGATHTHTHTEKGNTLQDLYIMTCD